MRPKTISIYKNEKETKLRHQIHLSDLSAAAILKDPKQKRKNVFGLFSCSRNFHFEAPTFQDAQDWVDLIRRDAGLEEEEEEMFLASPLGRSLSPFGMRSSALDRWTGRANKHEGILSSSPENQSTLDPPAPNFFGKSGRRRESSTADFSGLSGNEMYSHSDMSDTEAQRFHGASLESLAVQSPVDLDNVGSVPRQPALPGQRPHVAGRSPSQASGINVEQDSERVVWQGWLWMLRSKGGVKQWKNLWGVLRARSLILYKSESEYMAQWIVELSAVVDVVDIDAISKSKTNCLQIITEEKTFRFCAHDEEALVQFIGAYKSLLVKRRGLEARAAAVAAVKVAPTTKPSL